MRPREQDCQRPRERLDVVGDVAERGPHMRRCVPFSAEPRKRGLAARFQFFQVAASCRYVYGHDHSELVHLGGSNAFLHGFRSRSEGSSSFLARDHGDWKAGFARVFRLDQRQILVCEHDIHAPFIQLILIWFNTKP